MKNAEKETPGKEKKERSRGWVSREGNFFAVTTGVIGAAH